MVLSGFGYEKSPLISPTPTSGFRISTARFRLRIRDDECLELSWLWGLLTLHRDMRLTRQLAVSAAFNPGTGKH
jgi:hypothetical protein